MAEVQKNGMIPEGERGEVRFTARSGNRYLITSSVVKNTRILYSVAEQTGKLKKVATATSPLDLYEKIDSLEKA